MTFYYYVYQNHYCFFRKRVSINIFSTFFSVELTVQCQLVENMTTQSSTYARKFDLGQQLFLPLSNGYGLSRIHSAICQFAKVYVRTKPGRALSTLKARHDASRTDGHDEMIFCTVRSLDDDQFFSSVFLSTLASLKICRWGEYFNAKFLH